VFPDIRYLKVIEREKTHFKKFGIEEIAQEASAFHAGLKYHSLVDTVRESYMQSRGLYKFAPSSNYMTQAVKCLEGHSSHY
jgi:hypothetical protein